MIPSRATFLALLGALALPAAVVHAQDSLSRFEIEAAGQRWTTHWWAPSGDSARALVLVLHGAGGAGRDYLEKNGWLAKARAEGFVVAAPDGLPSRADRRANFLLNPRLWNSGQLPADNPRTRVDDIAFFRALLDDLARRTRIDPTRIFVTGHSNGAAMTFRLGAELSDRIAAIAPVMGQSYRLGAKPQRALPTLYLIGDADRLNPLEGGESRLPWGVRTTPPLQPGIDAWATTLGCRDGARVERNDDTVTVRRYAPCSDGTTFTIWTLKRQGHGWPGGAESGLPDRMLGPSRNAVNATEEVWRFFRGVIPRIPRGETRQGSRPAASAPPPAH